MGLPLNFHRLGMETIFHKSTAKIISAVFQNKSFDLHKLKIRNAYGTQKHKQFKTDSRQVLLKHRYSYSHLLFYAQIFTLDLLNTIFVLERERMNLHHRFHRYSSRLSPSDSINMSNSERSKILFMQIYFKQYIYVLL